MKNRVWIFLSAAAAGLSIAIGGTVYLSVENTTAGAPLFAVGLYVIVLNGLHLYTGKVGYLIGQEDKAGYGLLLALTWAGNLVGTGLGAACVLMSRISGISGRAGDIAAVKLSDTPASIFLLSVFCGFLMYAAVDGFKKKGNPLILFVCVSVFILCGFEHCVANMFYFSLAGVWSGKAVLYLLLMTLGNSAGGLLIPALEAFGKSETK